MNDLQCGITMPIPQENFIVISPLGRDLHGYAEQDS